MGAVVIPRPAPKGKKLKAFSLKRFLDQHNEPNIFVVVFV
jgi:hypothetical protein